jgi:hypothetical protein
MNIWKVLNKNQTDTSLSDTDERVVVMKKELLNTRGGMVRTYKSNSITRVDRSY